MTSGTVLNRFGTKSKGRLMTLPLTLKRRINRRIHNLPTVTHNCDDYGIWVRRNGHLVCRVCGRP